MPVEANVNARRVFLGQRHELLDVFHAELRPDHDHFVDIGDQRHRAKSRKVSNGIFVIMCGDTVTAPAVVRNSE